MLEIPGLVALSLVEMKLVGAAHKCAIHVMLEVRQVPGTLHCLGLLMSRVEKGCLLKVTLWGVDVSLVLPHHESTLLYFPVLFLCASLQECVHVIDLVAFTVLLLLVHLLRLSH